MCRNVLKQKAYSLLDASLTWTAPNGMFTVKGWGKNLTNTAYADQYDMTNFSDNIVVAPPRTHGVSLGFKY